MVRLADTLGASGRGLPAPSTDTSPVPMPGSRKRRTHHPVGALKHAPAVIHPKPVIGSQVIHSCLQTEVATSFLMPRPQQIEANSTRCQRVSDVLFSD
eukprot:2298066-Pyramimonas_sp.AAC.1